MTTDNSTPARRADGTVPAVVRLSESFTSTAKGKLEFVAGLGGRVVELVLEDCDGMQAHIDRFGRVTWTDKNGSEKQNAAGQGAAKPYPAPAGSQEDRT